MATLPQLAFSFARFVSRHYRQNFGITAHHRQAFDHRRRGRPGRNSGLRPSAWCWPPPPPPRQPLGAPTPPQWQPLALGAAPQLPRSPWNKYQGRCAPGTGRIRARNWCRRGCCRAGDRRRADGRRRVRRRGRCLKRQRGRRRTDATTAGVHRSAHGVAAGRTECRLALSTIPSVTLATRMRMPG